MEEPDSLKQILNQPLRSNSFTKYRYLFNSSWYNAGIQSIKNLFNDNGQLKQFSEIVTQHQIINNFLFYNKVVYNIPRKWREIISCLNGQNTSDNTCPPIREMLTNKAKKA